MAGRTGTWLVSNMMVLVVVHDLSVFCIVFVGAVRVKVVVTVSVVVG